MQTIKEAYQYAPLINAWSNSPFCFFEVVRDESLIAIDETKYVIKQIFLSDDDLLKVKEKYENSNWIYSIIEAIDALTNASYDALLREKSAPKPVLAILTNKCNFDIVSKIAENVKIDRSNKIAHGCWLVASIKIDQQSYNIIEHDEDINDILIAKIKTDVDGGIDPRSLLLLDSKIPIGKLLIQRNAQEKG